jgi:hypothetical protein
MPFNDCPACGAWEPEKRIEPSDDEWAIARCASCGEGQRFRRLPLFAITGPSGAGKTTVMHRLLHALPECVVVESDVLWGAVPADASDDYGGYLNVWLRLVKTIAQAGKPVLLCGTMLPDQLESLPERRYIGPIHYLALTCDPDVLRARLEARPAWRASGSEAFVGRMLAFNAWLRDNAVSTTPPLTLHDTSHEPPDLTAEAVRRWVSARLRCH